MSVGDVKLGNVRIARIVDRNGSRVNQDAITDAELRAAIIEQHGRHIQDRVDEELIRASAAVNRGDYPTRRASAMRFLELMRNRADIEAEPALSAFEQLDKLFIAQHIVANPALAAEGHKILRMLMIASFKCGRASDRRSADHIKKMVHPLRQAVRGQRSGETRRANRKWVPLADELVQQIMSETPGAKASRVADKTLTRWGRRSIPSPGYRTLYNHIRAKMGKV